MQGPVVDIVLLLLVILFFGVQQSRRPQRLYRFWFAGWILVLLSYLVWEPTLRTAKQTAIQDMVRTDLILAGTLLLLLSFLSTRRSMWKVMASGLVVGVPSMLILDLRMARPVSRLVLTLVVVVWHVQGYWAGNRILPREWPRRRRVVLGICVTFSVAILAHLWLVADDNLFDWAVAEVLLCTAMLYGGGSGQRSFARGVGTVGFALWAGFYLADMPLSHSPEAVKLLYAFWSFPKFFVGLSMILRVLEEANQEKADLAEQYRLLYEDFRLLYEGHPYPMWICDDSSGQIVSVNREAARAYGYREAEFIGLTMESVEIPMDSVEAERNRMLPLPQDGRRAQHRYKDGRAVWVNVMDHPIIFQGAGSRLVVARDITDRLKVNQELAHRANHDALTGLPNRTLLADRLHQCLLRCGREGRKGLLLTIDIDFFKRVNDTYGHLVGDECLRQVAARLACKIRQVDTLARVGGEEFMAIIGGLTQAGDAEKVAASLLRQFEEPMDVGGFELRLTVSIGAAIYPDDGEDARTLQERSDRALYQAKRRGRNRTVFAAQTGAELDAEAEVQRSPGPVRWG